MNVFCFFTRSKIVHLQIDRLDVNIVGVLLAWCPILDYNFIVARRKDKRRVPLHVHHTALHRGLRNHKLVDQGLLLLHLG